MVPDLDLMETYNQNGVIADSFSLPSPLVAQMLDMSAQGVVVHRGKKPLFLNKTMFEMVCGNKNAELETLDVLEWVHPSDRSKVAATMDARLKGAADELPAEMQFRLRRWDGADIWVSCRARRIDWLDGPAILASITDVTRLKETEQAHERSDALFKRVFQATPDMMSLSYLDTGVFLDVNDNLADAIGMDRRSIMGQSIFDLDIWAQSNMAMRIAAAIRRHGSFRRMEAGFKRVDGSVFPVCLSAESLVIDGRSVLLMIGRDITEDKRREDELRKSRDGAEIANRTKSAFLANMSHELRTPLNAILGFSEILKDEVLGPLGDTRYREYASDVHKSGTHLLEIINDILDLSKVEAGHLEIHPASISIAELIAQSMRLVRERAHCAKLTLETSITPSDFRVTVDERLFKQIILNLLTNAIKFTNAGGQIKVHVEQHVGGGCRLSVSDTGIGMTAQEVARALTPFGQVDASMTRRHEGTGLGLPLVAAFVDVHNGTLEIDSEKDVGTRVVVTLPMSPSIKRAR